MVGSAKGAWIWNNAQLQTSQLVRLPEDCSAVGITIITIIIVMLFLSLLPLLWLSLLLKQQPCQAPGAAGSSLRETSFSPCPHTSPWQYL